MSASQMPRGLEALFGRSSSSARTADATTIPVDRLEPNPYQPRQSASEKEIDELADSIRSEGLIQPIVATERGGRLYIIAGERRWRAAQKAGLSEVPVVIRPADERQMLVCALVENVQRKDLSPIEEAAAYDRLRTEFSFTADRVAALVGKSRPHVANMLRLLDLPPVVKDMVHQGFLSTGHAKVLLSLEEPSFIENVAHKAMHSGMSVRDLEKWIKEATGAGESPVRQSRKTSSAVDAVAAEMTERLGRRVWIKVKGRGKKQRGRIALEFTSPEDFQFMQEVLLRHLRPAGKS